MDRCSKVVGYDLEVQYFSFLKTPSRLFFKEYFCFIDSPSWPHVSPVFPQFKVWYCISCWTLSEAPTKAPVLLESLECDMCPLERALSLWNVSSWEHLAHVTDLFRTQRAMVWILSCTNWFVFLCGEFWLLVESFSTIFFFWHSCGFPQALS